MKRLIAIVLSVILASTMFTISASAAVLTRYDDNDSLIRYSGWSQYAVAGAYKNGVHSSPTPGAIMQAAFSDCTAIELYGGCGIDRAYIDVYVDGELKQSIDTYSATTVTNKLLFSITGLAKGEHVLQVIVSNKKNNQSIGAWAEVDGVATDGILIQKEIEKNDPEKGNQIIDDGLLCYSGNWTYYTMLDQARGFYSNTATSTQESGASASYTFAYCTGIRWYSTANSAYGTADVYIDGKKVKTVNVGSLPASVPTAVFDSGELTAGEHTITIVKVGSDDKYVEIDRIIGVGENKKGYSIINADNEGFFTASVKAQNGNIQLKEKGQTVMFSFVGKNVSLMGQGNNATAILTVDGVSKGKKTLGKSELVNVSNLSEGMHYVELELVSGSFNVTKAHVDTTQNVANALIQIANKELEVIEKGEKTVLDSSLWQPVTKSATVPQSGVTLKDGVLKTAFDRNIEYLKHCGSLTKYVDMTSVWTDELAASTEGRMMAGIGHTLRFTSDAELEAILGKILTDIKQRTGSDGWCMPYPQSYYQSHPGSMIDEDKNYDRVMLTRGLVAAGKAGRQDALEILRNFYDWFDTCEYLPYMLRGALGTQGSIGTILAYESPVGKAEDLYVNMQYYDMDWWLEALTNRIPEAIYRFPLNRPHSYLLVSVQSFLAQYVATGQQKYLDAVLGAWDIFNTYYRNTGGGICICEGPIYKPGNYTLVGDEHGVYENCGHVFWIELNSRLAELFPNEEKYTAQIEETIYNMLLGSQAENGYIRYHQLYNGTKYTPSAINTCCENMATGMFGSLPQYIWSIANDGLYLNLYAASSITAKAGDTEVGYTMDTNYPYENNVTVTVDKAATTKLNIRIPSWNTGDMDIYLNGAKVGSGSPGSYFVLERAFNKGDKITFTLNPSVKFNKYQGETQVEGYDRYAITYGPILLAAQGSLNYSHKVDQNKTTKTIKLNITALELSQSLVMGNNLEFTSELLGSVKYVPYMTIQTQTFAVFPVFNEGDEPLPEQPSTPAPTTEPSSTTTPTQPNNTTANTPTVQPTDALTTQPEQTDSNKQPQSNTVAVVAAVAAAAVAVVVTTAVMLKRKKLGTKK